MVIDAVIEFFEVELFAKEGEFGLELADLLRC